MTWDKRVQTQLDAIRDAGQWRAPVARDGMRNFASNDYLGLTRHPTVLAAAHEALDAAGSGSGSARLIVGSRQVHHDLEDAIASWKRTERAVLFATGYQANLSVLTTFGGPGVRVVSDELNHASIIDGCRLSRSDVAIFRHRDVEHAAFLLDGAGPSIVITDSVFSMDGDVAPLDDLAELCVARGALLVVDEAHAVLGPDPKWTYGEGTWPGNELNVVRVGTLSKTLGSLGGFAAASGPFCDLLVNRARPYIFTTASTPADSAAALAALAVLCSHEGETLTARLRAHVERVRSGHPSPIIPVMLGDERVAIDAAAFLAEHGLLVPAIRPPTVAPGTSRLRVALSASHRDEDITALIEALAALDAA